MNLQFRKYVLLAQFILAALLSAGQNNSDCNTAVSVCNAVYDEQDSPAGTGNVFEVAPGSCQTGGEFNSAWYIFSPQANGNLSFILQPNSSVDDYDWSVFNITDNGCAGINSGQSPEVSCNSYGETGGTQGPTGISSANGGFGNVNGPGNTNGPAFNADLSVNAGDVYALVVMNYSQTLNGYTLDFNSSAVSIFDQIAPVLENTEYTWCTGELILTFGEGIVSSSLTLADFALDQPGYTIQSFTMNDPEVADVFTFHITPNPLMTDVSLHLTTTNGEVLADICGNEAIQPIELNLQGGFQFTTTSTVGCNGLGASLNVNVTSGDNFPPYSVEINGQVEGNLPLLDIATGNYDIVITDNLGCSRDTSITIANQVATITLPADTVMCSLGGNFTAQYNGTQLQWEPTAGLTYSTTSSATNYISSLVPGLATVTAHVQTGDCEASDFMNITFNYPPQMEMLTSDVSCFGACDGVLEVINSNPASITVTFSGHHDVGPDLLFTDLCGGQYEMQVIHSPQCTANYTFTIAEPPAVIASFEVSDWIVPIKDPSVTLTSTSQNADSLFWSVANYDSLYSQDSIWQLVLPFEADTFGIVLMAKDTSGCTSWYRGNIEVRDEFGFYVPNCFTPNDDGLNDVFFVKFTYPPLSYDFKVFNRDGAVVFQTKDYSKVWEGDFNGGEYYCPNGVYDWQLTTRGVELYEKTYNGHLTILR